MTSMSEALQRANKATVKDIAAAANIPNTLTSKELSFTIRVARPRSLSNGDRDQIWTLYEANMRALVEPSSLGWDPEDKKQELFHRDSRFLLVHHQESLDAEQSDHKALVAFSMFRFEPGYEDEDAVYCYELQVADGYRGRGLCRFFVEKLSLIGKHWLMEKILLTVLKENTSARQAYAKLGFVVDTASPEYDSESPGHEECGREDTNVETEVYDYEILSKALL